MKLIVVVLCFVCCVLCQVRTELFPQGVASGDPTETSVQIWTRTNGAISNMTLIINSSNNGEIVIGGISTNQTNDFTVKISVSGLSPGTLYHYFFRTTQNGTSQIGKFVTPPPQSQDNFSGNTIVFGWTGASDSTLLSNGSTPWNPFDVFGAMSRNNLDFFIYEGDLIFADSSVKTKENYDTTVQEFWNDYRNARNFQNLQLCLLNTSMFSVWDDRELRAGWDPATINKTLLMNSRKAWDDYIPQSPYYGEGEGVSSEIFLQPPAVGEGGCAVPPMYKHFNYGPNLDIFILDTSSCRSSLVDVLSECGGQQGLLKAAYSTFFPEIIDGDNTLGIFDVTTMNVQCLAKLNERGRTMLGFWQRDTFLRDLSNSDAKYKIVVSNFVFADNAISPYNGWVAYPEERSIILSNIANQGINNVIFLATDPAMSLMQRIQFRGRLVGYQLAAGPVAYLTTRQWIENNTLDQSYPYLHGLSIQTAIQVNDILGVDCQNTSTPSYGVLELNPSTGQLKITLKDQTGQIINNEGSPWTQGWLGLQRNACSITFNGHLSSSSSPNNDNNNQ